MFDIHGCFVKTFLLGNSIVALGLLVGYAMPPLISLYIDKQIALTPGSQSYQPWKEIPVPVYQKFFFYNVTNSQEIEQFGDRPQLEEIGPFTYRSEWFKRDIDNDNTLNTIDFKHFKNWYFEPEMSVADHKMQLVTLNAPLAITLTLIQSAPSAVRLLVQFSLDSLSEGFFTKRSVKQLLFEGYPDLLTTFGPLLNTEMLSQGGHFGYMNARNNSEDGRYQINNGVDDIAKLNTINMFNGKNKLPYWNQHHGNCSSLEGATTGEIFPPIQVNQTQVKLFQPDFCRVWPMNYDTKLEHESGLRLKRFVATRDVFRNSTDLADNSCYFSHPRSKSLQHQQDLQAATNRITNSRIRPVSSQRMSRTQSHHNNNNNNNIPSAGSGGNRHSGGQSHQGGHQGGRVRHEWPAGVFTLAPCKFNAPIYISMPHFLDADPYYLSHVEGLQPDKSKHEFYVDLEPRTGSPVMMSARVQINVAISRPTGLVRFRNVPEIMFPIFWQELSVNLSGPVIDNLLLASRQADEATSRLSLGLLYIGVAVIVTTILFYINMLLHYSSRTTTSTPLQTSTMSTSSSLDSKATPNKLKLSGASSESSSSSLSLSLSPSPSSTSSSPRNSPVLDTKRHQQKQPPQY